MIFYPSRSAVSALVRLARHFGHGWVNFIVDPEERGDICREEVLFSEAVDRLGWWGAVREVVARMVEAERQPYDQGLRPCLEHVSGTGRYAWQLETSRWGEDEYLHLYITRRPGGAVVKARIALDHRTSLFEGATHVTVLPGAEDRHEEYMIELLRVAGVYEWVTDRTLPQCSEREVRLPRKAQRDPIAVDLAAWG